MKFVCEKCKTKYSISDEKVRRKVLKIRCKNCSNIILVQESGATAEHKNEARKSLSPESSHLAGGSETAETEPTTDADVMAKHAHVLDTSSEGAFKPRQKKQGPSPALRLSPDPLAFSDSMYGEESEPTRLGAPTFLDEPTPTIEDEWYLAIDGNQFGPMGFSEICSRIKRGETGSEAYTWRDGFEDWIDISDVAELKPFLPRHPPPPPLGRSGLFAISPMQSSLSMTMPPRPAVPHVPPLPPPSIPGTYLPSGHQQPNPAISPMLFRQQAALSNPGLPSMSPTIPPFQTSPGVISAGSSVDLASGVVSAITTSQEFDSRSIPLLPEHQKVQQPALQRPQPSTPLVMKIAAAAGIVAALCGVVLIVYFIFLDRPSKEQHASGPLLRADPSLVQSSALPVQKSDARGVSIGFSPMEIERSKENNPLDRSAKLAKVPTKTLTATVPKETLTDEQKRLLSLYNENPTGGKIPNISKPPPRKVNSRPITSSDIISMQKKHGSELNACYNRALKRDESLADTDIKGEATVGISDEGLVKSVSIQGIKNSDLVTCLSRNIRYWKFDPIGEKTFRFPVLFIRGK